MLLLQFPAFTLRFSFLFFSSSSSPVSLSRPRLHLIFITFHGIFFLMNSWIQVLHLMNKMNIPAPFRKALPTPPLPKSIPVPSAPVEPPPPPPSMETKVADLSSSESEMESSDEVILWSAVISYTLVVSKVSTQGYSTVLRFSLCKEMVNFE